MGRRLVWSKIPRRTLTARRRDDPEGGARADDKKNGKRVGKKKKGTREVTPIGNPTELAKHVRIYPERNTFRVIAKGFVFRHYINGKLMTECHDEDKRRRRASGLLALQLHAGPPMKVQFRDIRLKRLDSSIKKD